ncbi:hypothetical protein Pla22_41730 [Rubripirellula amarantea]|uniref:Uncharacterized protein n=1 Tax=Rubripirellula amarantea TaxID=2527999 RepID=A0A5C5WMI6_9BACT|nr:hypothetical protein Pla22_41730 [Rubripirellula amarantea]
MLESKYEYEYEDDYAEELRRRFLRPMYVENCNVVERPEAVDPVDHGMHMRSAFVPRLHFDRFVAYSISYL